MSVRIINADCREALRHLPDESVHCVVTSPPYFGLRDYGHERQIGLEPTPDEYVAELVSVFREVQRVLRKDGTLWLNLGDSYAGSGLAPPAGLKPKDLTGIPWRAAFALQADGWYLRQWLPWVKRNPMPESTQDRPTAACEVVFMLTRSPRYFFDYEAVKRRMAPSSLPRLAQDVDKQAGSARANGGAKSNGTMKAVGRIDKQRGHSRRHAGFNDRWDRMEQEQQCGQRALRNSDLFFDSLDPPYGALFNGESFIGLDVATQPFVGAHFAVMPPYLVQPLVTASCPVGGTVLDPFGGAGTTGLVADRLGRNAILIEVNPEYAQMAADRIRSDQGMFTTTGIERPVLEAPELRELMETEQTRPKSR